MEYNYKKIEKYINGELTMAELKNFEQELRTNDTLKEEVALYKDVAISLTDYFQFEKEDKHLKSTFNNLGQKYATAENVFEPSTERKISHKETEQKTIVRYLFPITAIAAAAALLLFLFNPFINQLSPAQLAEQHFTPHQLESFMGNGSNDLLNKGKKYYNSGAYTLAIENFNKYLAIQPNDIDVQLAKGCAQLELNQADAAIQTFEKIKDNISAKWYLALAYVQKEETAKAKTIFESLLDNKTYGKHAKLILKDL